MGYGGLLSGGVVVALAAVLWLIYLVPTMRRRNEYLATERNAVRLQQTMRILAETADVPEDVRMEISAREVAEKQKVLRKVQAEARERAKAEALEEAARLRAELTARGPIAAQRTSRRKRARRTSTLVMALGFVALVIGVIVAATGGAPVLAIVGGLAFGTGVSLVVRLARPETMVQVPAVQVAPVAEAAVVQAPAQPFQDFAPEPVRWTPNPLPKPMYQSEGSVAATAMARADAQDALRRAALAQVLADRAEELAPPAPAPIRREEPKRPPSKFDRMGVVDDIVAETGAIDLIARRRNVG